jgi:hypothetical protein
MDWAGVGWGSPDLLTAQLAFVFSLGAVLVEVAGLPELEDCPIPTGEGALQCHLGARGRSWGTHRHTFLVNLGGSRHWPPCGQAIGST